MAKPEVSGTRVICADWGTTNLRLFLVEVQTSAILERIALPHGILSIHKSYLATTDPGDRISYFRHRLQSGINELANAFDSSIKGLDVIVSGMAGSSIGITELPYTVLPFSFKNSQLHHQWLAPVTENPHRLLLLSGLAKEDDVMRGEEIQAIGWQTTVKSPGNYLVLFPGTHSKHILVQDDQLIDFKTYLTGELYNLLIDHSILKPTSEAVRSGSKEISNAFYRGVEASKNPALLHELFRIRGQLLNKRLPSNDISDYLSGLLIGNELRQCPDEGMELHLVASEPLLLRYEAVLSAIQQKSFVKWGSSDLTHFTIQGQIHAWSRLGWSDIEVPLH